MKFGVTLSGGGARGIAHLGFLQVLDELDFQPDKILGVSAGSIIGTMYAAGYSPLEILEIVEQTNFFRLLRPAFSLQGLLNIERLEPLYLKYISHNSFEKLKIPTTIMATDLDEGEAVFFSEGNLMKPVLASSCIPVIFNPIRYQGKTLVDGGVINNMPHQALEDCTIKIGVHVNPYYHEKSVRSMRTVVERSLLLSIHSNAFASFQYFDLVIEPKKLNEFTPFSIAKAKEIYHIGYQETMKQKDELLKLKDFVLAKHS